MRIFDVFTKGILLEDNTYYWNLTNPETKAILIPVSVSFHGISINGSGRKMR